MEVDLQYLACVFLLFLRVYQYVIEIYDHEHVDEFSQALIYVGLKGGRAVAQPKW